jgi:YaiO family outer membrane protein
MSVALLVIVLLAASAAGAQAGQLPTQAEAEELARQGNPQAALEAFQRRAAANPGDHAARIWIARLHEQMGHPELAEPVYRSVMLEAPDNVDALLGVGTSLVSLQRGDEALLVLDRAAKLAPQNTDVLAAVGAAHLQAGNITLGLSYLQQASRGGTPATRDAYERARRAHGHRIAASAFFEQFNGGVSDTSSGNLAIDYRLRDSLRVMARGQYQRKFGFSDQRGGAGFEWRWQPQTTLAVHALVGPDNDVLPETDALLQISHTTRSTGWDLGYRYVDFQGAHVSVISPGVRWLGERITAGLRYSIAITNFDSLPDAEDGHSGSLDGAYRLQPRLWLNLGYAYGVEDFDTLSPDRLGRFKAHTVRGGFRVDLASLTSVEATYEHQWRPGDAKMNRISGVVTQAF